MNIRKESHINNGVLTCNMCPEGKIWAALSVMGGLGNQIP